MASLTTVGVVGCGIMGAGIAETCARGNCAVVVREVDELALDAGRTRIARSLNRARTAGKIDAAQRAHVEERLSFTTSLEDFGACDVVIEAVAEQLAVKTEVFAQLDAVLPAGALLASNTSSIPIAALASATSRPGSVIGMHFFNPVPVMPLVELIPSVLTDPETSERARHFAGEVLGKTVIEAPDRAGFIVNALLIPYLLAAIRMVESGIDPGDVDTGMEVGCAQPMGPIRLSDFIGLDTVQAIAESLLEEFAEPLYAPPPLLRRMVTAGLLGKKSGRGFYDYTTGA